jgi:predicted enzyme related to lactoylglutathione lyase
MADSFDALQRPYRPRRPDTRFAVELLRRLEQEAGMPTDLAAPTLTRTLIPKMVHLGVSDADRAARFFGEVLEWQTERVEYRGHVRHYVLGDFAVRPCITDEPGAPPVQLGFEVADVAASVARVLGAGGRIVVDDVEETGRFVAARDDQDVALAFWNYGPPSPPPLGGWPPVGGLAYFAIHVPDVERGIEFYGRVLDWTFEDPEPADYRHVADHVEPVAMGIRGDARPGIWLYFIVRDLDAAVASIRALGGEVLDRSRTGPMDTVECRDDQGLSFRIAIPAP